MGAMSPTKQDSFFKQSTEQKMRVSKSKSKYFNGYNGPRSTNISPGESVDIKESVLARRIPEHRHALLTFITAWLAICSAV
ncbi:MAG: hypothetical protein CL912_08760 [Deltaproteobacteria bacterium]|nr:hypothetical protein [Deltaproteobacteria bacterium]